MCKRQKSDEDVDAFETTANVSNGGLKIPLAEDGRQASLSWGHFDMLDASSVDSSRVSETPFP